MVTQRVNTVNTAETQTLQYSTGSHFQVPPVFGAILIERTAVLLASAVIPDWRICA